MKDRYYFVIFPMLLILTRIRYINNIYDVISYLMFGVVNYAISIVLFIKMKRMSDVNLKKIIILILSLVSLDQLIKLIIDRYDINVNILGKLFRIEPTKNMEQNAALNFLKIELDDSLIIVFKLLLIFILFGMYFIVKNKNRNYMSVFILLMSAAIVTLIDSVFWGYTLDYIYFNKLTCYDLKDFYVDTAIGFILMEQFGGIKIGKVRCVD